MTLKEECYWCARGIDVLYNRQLICGSKKDEIINSLERKLIREVYKEIEKGV